MTLLERGALASGATARSQGLLLHTPDHAGLQEALAARAVAPEASAPRSSRVTSAPSSASCQAAEAPTMPPPITIASAIGRNLQPGRPAGRYSKRMEAVLPLAGFGFVARAGRWSG